MNLFTSINMYLFSYSFMPSFSDSEQRVSKPPLVGPQISAFKDYKVKSLPMAEPSIRLEVVEIMAT
jgi:hypothetical protein